MSKTEKESKPLYELAEVHDTPFTIAKKQKENSEDYEYHVLMGNYRLNEFPLTYEESMEIIEKPNWKVIFSVIAILIENQDKLKTKKK